MLDFMTLTEHEQTVWYAVAKLLRTQDSATFEDISRAAQMGNALVCMVLGSLTFKGYVQGVHDKRTGGFSFRLFVWPAECAVVDRSGK